MRAFLVVVVCVLAPVVSIQLQDNGTSCRLLTYVPFTDLRLGPGDYANPDAYGFGNWPGEEALSEAAISLVAVAEMARQHFVSHKPHARHTCDVIIRS